MDNQDCYLHVVETIRKREHTSGKDEYRRKEKIEEIWEQRVGENRTKT